MTTITDFIRIRGSSHHHTGALDIGVIGSTAEALLCATSISQLDIVTVKASLYLHLTVQSFDIWQGDPSEVQSPRPKALSSAMWLQVFSCAHTEESDKMPVVSIATCIIKNKDLAFNDCIH